jgi:PKD repeat protein
MSQDIFGDYSYRMDVDNPNDNATMWNWSPDGGSTWTNSTTQNYSHIYGSYGIYSVIEVAQNYHALNMTTVSWVVTNETPVSMFIQNASSGFEPTVVAFTDISSGNPDRWEWYFTNDSGNSSMVIFSTDKNPVHVFGVGNWSIQQYVWNDRGETLGANTSQIDVFPHPPVASFTQNVTTEIEPAAVQFNDTSTNSPSAWSWAYKNATAGWTQFSTDQNPVYIFPKGVYDINLTASNDGGSNDLIKPAVLLVYSIYGMGAVFSFAPVSGITPLTVIFIDGTTGSPTSWNWSFGDGSYSDNQNPTHTFVGAGAYTVILNASNLLDQLIHRHNFLQILRMDRLLWQFSLQIHHRLRQERCGTGHLGTGVIRYYKTRITFILWMGFIMYL